MTDSSPLSPLATSRSWSRGISSVLVVALVGASLGTTTAALAQQKPTPAASAKTPAPAAKPPTSSKAAAAAKPADKKKAPKDPKKEAGQHFKKGEDLFKKKQFKEAKEQYEEAEELFPGATPKYMIARCAEELGQYEEAAAWYDKAIELKKLKPEQQKDAEDRSAALKARPAKVHVASDPAGATIIVDGKALPEKTPADIELAPGKHKLALGLEKKKPWEQEIDVASFKGADVTATLEAVPEKVESPFEKAPPPPPPVATVTPPAQPAQPETRARRDNTWVYITGAAAIVGLGVGTFFGVKALKDKSDFDATPTQDIHDRGTRDALVSDMGFGIGVTLAITSAVLYFTQPSPEGAHASTGLRIAPVAAPGPNGIGFAGATASFRF